MELIDALSRGRNLPRLSLESSLVALSETACFYLHFIDRTLSDSAREQRDERMDALILELASAQSEIIQRHTTASAEDAAEVAVDGFQEIYNDRQEEYAALGDRWLEKLVLRASSYLIQALYDADPQFEFKPGPDHYSFRLLATAESMLGYGAGDLLKATPELFGMLRERLLA
jgi:hypothetical protein